MDAVENAEWESIDQTPPDGFPNHPMELRIRNNRFLGLPDFAEELLGQPALSILVTSGWNTSGSFTTWPERA